MPSMVVELRRRWSASPRTQTAETRPTSTGYLRHLRVPVVRAWWVRMPPVSLLVRHAIGIAAVVGFLATRSNTAPAGSVVLFGFMALGYVLISFGVEQP